MKLIVLFAFILIFSLAKCEVVEIKKPLARTVAPEDLALELEFYATCQEFKDRILPSVWISKHDLCLPIQFNVTNNPDVDDLRTHYFCTNIDHGRSIVHFVEIYETDETIQFPNFVLSLVPTNPFRILTKRTTVSRRPNCFITNDYCSPVNAIVNSCRSNPVLYKRGFVVSHDRIYITANQQESRDCRTSVTECCAYVAPLTLGGICENVASTDLLKLPKKHKYGDDKHHNNDHHDNDHHDNDHHDKPHGKPHGKPQHDNDHHDNDHHDNDHHDNDHHDNDHGNNHHWNNNHHNGKPQHDDDHDNDHHDNDHGNNHHWNNNQHNGKPQHGKEESNDQEDNNNEEEKK